MRATPAYRYRPPSFSHNARRVRSVRGYPSIKFKCCLRGALIKDIHADGETISRVNAEHAVVENDCVSAYRFFF